MIPSTIRTASVPRDAGEVACAATGTGWRQTRKVVDAWVLAYEPCAALPMGKRSGGTPETRAVAPRSVERFRWVE